VSDCPQLTGGIDSSGAPPAIESVPEAGVVDNAHGLRGICDREDESVEALGCVEGNHVDVVSDDVFQNGLDPFE
jgi:hypothetical protein